MLKRRETVDLRTWCLRNGERGQQLMSEWVGVDADGQLISMDSISYGSKKRVKWRCSEGHEWTTPLSNRTSSSAGCPYCSGRFATTETSLATWCLNNGEWGKQLLREWVGLTEDNQPISTNNIARASNMRVKWRCSNGHEWVAPVNNRTCRRLGCAICHGQLPLAERNLKLWCQTNGECGQQIMREWLGLTEDNQPISMDAITQGSSKKVKWRCLNGHEWIASVRNRVTNGHGCPFCAGTQASEDSNLEIWCKTNGAWGQRLLKEWVGSAEDGTPISMNCVTRASCIRVNWRCRYGHEWVTAISQRTLRRTGCPICSSQARRGQEKGRVSLLDWCLSNGARGQQLMNEWAFRVAGNPFGMDDVSYGSEVEVSWRCKQGHTWLAPVVRRTSCKTDCPYCAGRRVSSKNSLEVWCQNNGIRGQQLIEEWLGVDESDQPISMNAVARGSAMRIKWKCKQGHVWVAPVWSRTKRPQNCPYCYREKRGIE